MSGFLALAAVCVAAHWCSEPTGATLKSQLSNGCNPPLVIENVLIVDPQEDIDEQLLVRNLLMGGCAVGELESWSCCNLASRTNRYWDDLWQSTQVWPSR